MPTPDANPEQKPDVMIDRILLRAGEMEPRVAKRLAEQVAAGLERSTLAGDLPQRGIAPDQRAEPSKNILNDTGQADMAVNRGPNGGGISGVGGLFTVVFQAVGRGNTNVSVASVSLTASTGQPLPATAPPPLVVNVK